MPAHDHITCRDTIRAACPRRMAWGKQCTSVGKTAGQGLQDWKTLLVSRHEDGHSLLLFFFFFNTFPFVEEVACRRVKQLQLFLGL